MPNRLATAPSGFRYSAASSIRASSSNNPFDRPPHVQASGIRRDVNQRGLAQLGQAELLTLDDGLVLQEREGDLSEELLRGRRFILRKPFAPDQK